MTEDLTDSESENEKNMKIFLIKFYFFPYTKHV